jgi:hypothetical protein
MGDLDAVCAWLGDLLRPHEPRLVVLRDDRGD